MCSNKVKRSVHSQNKYTVCSSKVKRFVHSQNKYTMCSSKVKRTISTQYVEESKKICSFTK